MKFISKIASIPKNCSAPGRLTAVLLISIAGAAGLGAEVLDSTEIIVQPKVIQQVDEDLEVYFYYSKSKLKPGNLEELKKLVIPAGSTVIIHGHASPDGYPKYELKLSHDRATKIRHLLKKFVQENATYEIKGHGRTKPRYSNSSAGERAKNRRATIKIVPPSSN